MSLEERTNKRKKKMIAHVSRSFDEAEIWDLAYWQAMTPEERLSALVAIRKDVEKVLQARSGDPAPQAGERP